MATKPTVHAEWDTNDTNTSATTSGHKSDGWVNNEIPTAAEFNHWMRQVGLWTNWLLEAQLNDGVVNYTHVDSVQDDHDLTGTGTLTNVHTVYVTLSSTGEDQWVFSGAVGGVDKQEIQIINLDATRYIEIQDQAYSASTAANQIILPEEWTYGNVAAGISTAAHISPGGTLKLRYHGADSRWRVVGHTGVRVLRRFTVPTSGAQLVGTHTVDQGHVTMGGVPNIIYVPLVTVPGSRIYSYKAYLNKVSTSGDTVSAWLYKRDTNDATATAVGIGNTNNANNPGYITLTETFSSLLAGEVSSASNSLQYFVEISDTSAASDQFLHVDFFVWVPA
jgi:hypothetical protein